MRHEDFVQATLQYTVDNGRPLDYYFYEPGDRIDLNPPGTDRQLMRIQNGWPQVDQFSADREGFELQEFTQEFQSFDDDTAVKRDFYEQVVAFVKKHSGANRVVVFDHTIRKRLPPDLNVQTTVQRPAVLLVHSDYTEKSAPQRVRDILPAEADELLQRRIAFYNVWKPLSQRVEELPLAMCDASSASDQDMLLMDLKYAERTGEIYVMRHSAQHRWYYFPQMEAHHALLLKTYDSALDGRARFMGHSAFEDPNTPPNALKRESIEVRTMAFFDN